MIKTFAGKVIVVTGASSGMGREYALLFAREGSILALCDFDPLGLEETKAKVIQQTPQCKVFSAVLDVSDQSAVESFSTDVKKALGNAFVVINNAGIAGGNSPVWLIQTDDFERTMKVNFWGVVNGTRAFLPQLLEEGTGAIVNVSSVFGLLGTPNNSDYCASKFAVRGFTESLAVELSQSLIQVHLVYPGGIDTNIAAKSKNGEFSRQFLTTPAIDMVERVKRGILRNEPRIIYGNNAAQIWWGVRLLPFSKLRHRVWNQMKSALDMSDYQILK